LYEVYSRKDPYDGEDPAVVLREVADKQINKRPPVPRDCPSQLAGIMKDCLSANPDDRPSFEELDKRLRRVDIETAEPSSDPKSTAFGLKKTVSLHDIFPSHIADAMHAGRKIEPEQRCVPSLCGD
jgi:Protein tyrosine and serine/threonine kinase